MTSPAPFPSTALVAIWLSNLISSALNSEWGSFMTQSVFGNLTRADLCTAVILLVLVLATQMALGGLQSSNEKKTASGEKPGGFVQIFSALARPFSWLTWLGGFYLAIAPLWIKSPDFSFMHGIGLWLMGMVDLGLLGLLLWMYFRLTRIFESRLAAWAVKMGGKLDLLFIPFLGSTLRIAVPVLVLILALPFLNLPPAYAGLVGNGSSLLLIVGMALICVQAVHGLEMAVLARHNIHAPDNLHARKIYTQVHVLAGVLDFIIGIFAVASILMLFEPVRHLGTSLLASAGVVSVVAGFAAQKTISNLFAGFQLALTQPIRLDDVVIVEQEWGRVEEITLTYVVIRIWDERRLIVPLSYFIEKPFQNWTRTSAELLGSVLLWVDYSLPLDEIRQVLKGMIEKHPLWDRRFWNLQVSDATEHSMQIRVLATAADSTKTWDLRCAIREELIGYIQKHHPQSLPLLRTRQSSPPPS